VSARGLAMDVFGVGVHVGNGYARRAKGGHVGPPLRVCMSHDVAKMSSCHVNGLLVMYSAMRV
jgi:hypothetical protein